MFLFKPALWRAGLLFELPRPITSLRLQDTWDYAKFKVPLCDGDASAGHSRNGVDIALEGQLGSRAGELTLDESTMFLVLESLRAQLHVGDSSDSFQFFLYHDPESAAYRSFKDCHAVRFESDLTDKNLFTYAAVIHAADPKIHSDPPA